MDPLPPRQAQPLGSVRIEGTSPTRHCFRLHKPSRLSRDLVLYSDDERAVAYNATFSASAPFSSSPNLRIYRGLHQSNSSTAISTDTHADSSQSGQRLLATAKISQLSGSFTLSLNDRTIDVPSHTLGWYKFHHEWRSSQGMVRWKHGKYDMAMQLLDPNNAVLGGVEVDGGADGRKGGLWVRESGGEDNKEWIDEVVCVAIGVLLSKPTKT